MLRIFFILIFFTFSFSPISRACGPATPICAAPIYVPTVKSGFYGLMALMGAKAASEISEGMQDEEEGLNEDVLPTQDEAQVKTSDTTYVLKILVGRNHKYKDAGQKRSSHGEVTLDLNEGLEHIGYQPVFEQAIKESFNLGKFEVSHRAMFGPFPSQESCQEELENICMETTNYGYRHGPKTFHYDEAFYRHHRESKCLCVKL